MVLGEGDDGWFEVAEGFAVAVDEAEGIYEAVNPVEDHDPLGEFVDIFKGSGCVCQVGAEFVLGSWREEDVGMVVLSIGGKVAFYVFVLEMPYQTDLIHKIILGHMESQLDPSTTEKLARILW